MNMALWFMTLRFQVIVAEAKSGGSAWLFYFPLILNIWVNSRLEERSRDHMYGNEQKQATAINVGLGFGSEALLRLRSKKEDNSTTGVEKTHLCYLAGQCCGSSR